jgi:hypothetical protein
MLFILSLLSCADYTMMETKEPEVIVAPQLLDFGHALSGFESKVKEITIANGGTQDLIVDHLEVVGDNYSVEEEGFVVPAGGWYQIDVGYTPVTFEHNEGYVDIYLEGDNSPSESVWLDGYGDAPLLTLSPVSVDFGSPLIGCEPSQEIVLSNEGNIDLVITDVTYMTNVPQEIDLNYGSLGAFPWTLLPGAQISFWSDYLPLDELADRLDFNIASNDPHAPTTASVVQGSAVLSNEVREQWLAESVPVVDIIWVIDNSGSMSRFQSLLAGNMQNFMNIFLSYSPDFQIAFITTDNPFFVGSVIDTNSADPSGQSSTIITSIGVHGSATEKGLEQLISCFAFGDCSTYVRPNSNIVAIFMSDEDDFSTQTSLDVQTYFNNNWTNEFVPFAIIGDVPGGCSNNSLFAFAAHEYYDLVNAYGSSWWSICDSDWGSQMQDVAEAIAIRTFYELASSDPVIDSISVFINGQELTEGWEYSEDRGGVVFEPSEAPQGGETLEIVYSSWGCTGE